MIPERRIEWSEAARRRVIPRRKADLPAPPALDREALWREITSAVALDRLKLGLAATDGSLRAAVKKALALLRQPTAPKVAGIAPWSVVLQLAAGHGSIRGGPMDFMVASAGVRKVIAIWAEAMRLELVEGVVRVGERPRVVWPSRNLRYALLRAPAPTRRWAREALAPAFEQGSLRLRAELLSVLPNEADWAERVARQLLETGGFEWPVVEHLLAALDDPDLVHAVLSRAPPGLWSYEHVLDALGLDAVPVLLALGRRRLGDVALERLADALSIVGHEDVARFMAGLPRQKRLRPHVDAHRARFPEMHAGIARRTRG